MALESVSEALGAQGGAAGSENWKTALESVVPCVVVLKVTQTRACDTESAGSSYATGFIVDRQRGIMLTNRHVVTPGPIRAEAIFLNREEIPVLPAYMDPVHDFAFMRFDPAKLQYMEVGEVPLDPQGAAVGLDIRVVGNDSGEKVSILASTLARLDRDAPNYGKRSYNDFNTYYFQAASGTKGGSSGSPVIDSRGRAIALNAGGKNKAASAYYLPLDRVVRALKLLQAANPLPLQPQWRAAHIPRGDLQTTFTFKGFDEVRRLGLRQETEAAVRAAPGYSHGAPGAAAAAGGPQLPIVGMLVVDTVVPGSPSDGVLEPGDVLVRVNGRIITHFLPLEEILDDAAAATPEQGGIVEVEIERGGRPMRASIRVTDLHAVTPSCLLELCGGSVHALSYQQARNNVAHVGQVYVAEPGYMLGRAAIPKGAIITALAGVPTPDLAAFAGVLRLLSHGQRVPVEYFCFGERHRRKNALMQVDRQWYGPPLLWRRDDNAGVWHPTSDYPPPGTLPGLALPAKPVTPAVADAPAGPPDAQMCEADGQAGAVAAVAADGSMPLNSPAYEAAMRSCLCLVDVDIPLVALSDGVHSRSFAGCGLVVHHSDTLGLVVVDRNTVAIGCCDVNISFGAHPAEVTGRVRHLHPLHNFAIVSYNPADLSPEARAKVAAAQLRREPALQRGELVRLVGLTKFARLMQRESRITNSTAALSISAAEVPRFRAVHEEVVKLDMDFGSAFSGVLTDERGHVRALWGSYAEQVDKEEREWCAGMPAHVFEPWVRKLVAQHEKQQHKAAAASEPATSTVSVLNAELECVQLSKAAHFGLPHEWVSRLERLDPERRQVLRVRSTVAGSSASQVLRSGDMLLAVDGKPVTSFRAVESLIATAGCRPAAAHVVAAATSEGLATPASSVLAVPDDAAATASSVERPAKRPRSSGPRVPAGDAAVVAAGEALPAAGLMNRSLSDAAEIADTAGDGMVPTTGGVSAAVAAAAPKAAPEAPSVRLSVFRGAGGLAAEVMDVSVSLGLEDGMGTGRLVHWCGAQLQAPHRAVRELGFVPPGGGGVYVSRWHHGSPAHRYGLYALHWVAEVNGQPTPCLESFVQAVTGLEDGAFVRVKLVHLESAQPKVLTLKTDLKYWPTWELRLDPATAKWERHVISQAADTVASKL